ncbi:hypothetical protein G6F61_014559 [Rhizopus arrhizus]|nr:hypothetical protein G6F61_014559 [Rhizopus arrhizus]
MTTDLHDLKPGYYWYTMANDPLAVIHIHEDGGASLMGTDYRIGAEGVADMPAAGAGRLRLCGTHHDRPVIEECPRVARRYRGRAGASRTHRPHRRGHRRRS